MGIVDTFSKEDRVDVKYSDFYNLVKGCASQEMIINAINCDVPHKHIREMVSGKKGLEAFDVSAGSTENTD